MDMRHKGKWDIITAEDLENAKPEIKKGDFVVINTGWHKYFKTKSNIILITSQASMIPPANGL